ncbi:carboxypeptidase regulatory-like domain-containing protein [Niastella caeni]|uniref:Carboxypeptidase regulatory-like domain-containing protein n=1 Tax=Niastella caeni TaxID=2569763 RepID=A0A4S8HAK5_9BACT|nr:carboxypeptidase-like regulatory domain-containing protein [Niastella caeni]THU31950.1 carboxypeptidase regulatory-like domain-containing protein [Niastella caeni]
MEKSGYVNTQSRKGWLAITVILSCFLIGYWLIKNNNFDMAAGTTTSVRGFLYKSSTGAPIEGATVMVAEGSYEHPDIAAQTDEQGSFSLPELRVPGTYTLLINYSSGSKRLTVNITKDSVLRIPL